MRKKFSKTIYVAIETNENDETAWYQAEDDPAAHAVINVSRRIAIYKLDRIVHVTADAKIVP